MENSQRNEVKSLNRVPQINSTCQKGSLTIHHKATCAFKHRLNVLYSIYLLWAVLLYWLDNVCLKILCKYLFKWWLVIFPREPLQSGLNVRGLQMLHFGALLLYRTKHVILSPELGGKEHNIVKRRWEKHIKTKLLFIQRHEIPKKRTKGIKTWAKLNGRKHFNDLELGRNLEKENRELRACWNGNSSVYFFSKSYAPVP